MSNLIGKSVLVDLEVDSFFGTVIDQNNKRGTVTVIGENDQCLEVFIDQVTIDWSDTMGELIKVDFINRRRVA